jgi:magnesium chelatase family protein
VARYHARLSGPLLDRIDLQVEVGAVQPDELMAGPDGESSATVAMRVNDAREIALARQGVPNAELAGAALDAHCVLDAGSRSLLTRAAERLGWSARSLHRVLRVARTVADLHGSDRIRSPHIAEAMQWRRALPVAA